jgi:multidrug efflux system membrane fusion protein
MPVRLETIGNVQTIASVAVKSRVDAYITEVKIQDGQYVKAGDVLFRLDSRAAEAQVHQMEGQLARDRAQLANAKRETERQQPLAAKDFVSRQQMDQVVTTAQSLEAAVKADEAALESARVQLTYYTITSPLDGRVGAINLKAGNNVKNNDVALVTINEMKPIYVGFSLPQTELPGVRTALAAGPVEVLAQAAGDSGPPETGRVTFFDNAVDTATGTIAMKATFANERERLWPGQFVNVAVTLRTEPDALVVPEAAVQIGQNNTYVWLAKPDNTAEMRPVTVNRSFEGKSVIAEGLAPGDRVVTDGQLRLTNGSRVEIKEPAAQRQPGAAS